MIGLMKKAALQGIKFFQQSIEWAVEANPLSSGLFIDGGQVDTLIMISWERHLFILCLNSWIIGIMKSQVHF